MTCILRTLVMAAENSHALIPGSRIPDPMWEKAPLWMDLCERSQEARKSLGDLGGPEMQSRVSLCEGSRWRPASRKGQMTASPGTTEVAASRSWKRQGKGGSPSSSGSGQFLLSKTDLELLTSRTTAE